LYVLETGEEREAGGEISDPAMFNPGEADKLGASNL